MTTGGIGWPQRWIAVAVAWLALTACESGSGCFALSDCDPGAPDVGPISEDAAVQPGAKWHCEQLGPNCICDVVGLPGDSCDKPKPSCCFASSSRYSDCTCWAADSERCKSAKQPGSGYFQLPTCPPIF